MTLRRDAQNHSKMVSGSRLPVRYCIMVMIKKIRKGLEKATLKFLSLSRFLFTKLMFSLKVYSLVNCMFKFSDT